METEANTRQVGGSHYRGVSYQHWDLVADSGMNYFEGQITKYLSRWKKKNGLQDLEKSVHYCQKLIEIQNKPFMRIMRVIRRFLPQLRHVPERYIEFRTAYELTVPEHEIFILVMTWTTKSDLEQIRIRLEHLMGFADVFLKQEFKQSR